MRVDRMCVQCYQTQEEQLDDFVLQSRQYASMPQFHCSNLQYLLLYFVTDLL